MKLFLARQELAELQEKFKQQTKEMKELNARCKKLTDENSGLNDKFVLITLLLDSNQMSKIFPTYLRNISNTLFLKIYSRNISDLLFFKITCMNCRQRLRMIPAVFSRVTDMQSLKLKLTRQVREREDELADSKTKLESSRNELRKVEIAKRNVSRSKIYILLCSFLGLYSLATFRASDSAIDLFI